MSPGGGLRPYLHTEFGRKLAGIVQQRIIYILIAELRQSICPGGTQHKPPSLLGQMRVRLHKPYKSSMPDLSRNQQDTQDNPKAMSFQCLGCVDLVATLASCSFTAVLAVHTSRTVETSDLSCFRLISMGTGQIQCAPILSSYCPALQATCLVGELE